MEIITATKESEESLKTLLPIGTKVDNVFIVITYLGDIVSQPAVSTTTNK